MSKNFRTILTFIFIFLFLAIAPIVVLYSQGYRFDFEKNKIVQTGAFYFKVKPNQVNIYINNKLVKKTSILFDTAYIKNLLPKNYNVKIEKDNYYSWEKNLEIKKELVTEGKNIILFPKNANFSLFKNGVDNYWLSPDKKSMVLKNTENSLILINIKNKEKIVLLTKENLKKKNIEILDLKWSNDSKKILLKLSEKDYLIIHIEGNECKKTDCFIKFPDKISMISFYPNQGSKLFFIKKNNLFEIDYLKKQGYKTPFLNNVITYSIFNKNIIWMNNEGFLSLSDISGKVKKLLNTKPFEIKQGLQYNLKIANESKIFVLEKNVLFFLDSNEKEFKKISNFAKNLKISDDSKKAVYWNNYEILLFFIEKDLTQPQKTFQEKVFLTRFSEKIEIGRASCRERV